MKKNYLLLLACSLVLISSTRSQNIFSENFEDVPSLMSSQGWVFQNNSNPIGAEVWHNGDGNGLALPAFNGTTFSFAEASFLSIDALSVGTISNWLITPTINLKNGDVISFYTNSYANSNFPDRLELRLNPLNTTDVGLTETTIGDFTMLLLSVNPNLLTDTAAYPETFWGQFSATVSGLSGPTDTRLAFRYFVTDGGAYGNNSSTIGIDALSIDFPVSINKVPEHLNLSVYPNPATDKLSIAFKEALTANGILKVYDSTGKKVISLMLQKGQSKSIISLEHMAKGMYAIVVEVDGYSFTNKFMKN